MADLRHYVAGFALADNLATPTGDFQFVGSFGMMYDGVAWDMLRGDATNGILVNLGANNGVTVTGTVTVDTELPNAAALSDNFANPTAPAVGSFLMLWDGSTWDRGKGDSTDGLLVNLGANNDVTVTGTVTVSATNLDIRDLTQASDNVRVYANTAKDGSGTAYIPLVDTDGHLQVDVLSGAGSTTPTNPATDYVTSAGVSAGAESNLDTGDLPAKKLHQVTVWSSVAWRGRVFLVNNSVEGTEALAVIGGPAFSQVTWAPSHVAFATLGTSGGTDAFRVEFINLDNENAADAHAVFAYSD